MTEDLLVAAGVLLASVVCGWSIVHVISTVTLPAPDEVCAVASECLALAFGG